jgi:hypothetical protein
MRRLFTAIAAVGVAAGVFATPAHAEIIKTDAALAGKNFCWSSGWDAEQFGHDHSYTYSLHLNYFTQGQFVLHGTWAINRDGVVTLNIDGGGILVRRYEVNGEYVRELTGTLFGGSAGHVC